MLRREGKRLGLGEQRRGERGGSSALVVVFLFLYASISKNFTLTLSFFFQKMTNYDFIENMFLTLRY